MKAVNPYVQKVREFSENILEIQKNETLIDLRQKVQKSIKECENVIVEIGSGSGNHIVSLATQNNHCIYFGFELRYKRSYRTIEKCKRRGLSNVFVVRYDAKAVKSFFKEKQVNDFYINFPDPWQKRRRRKNRTLGRDFLDSSSVLLKTGGTINFKTDHAEYFETFLDEMRLDKRFQIEVVTRDLHRSKFAETNILTEFEAMFIEESLPIYYFQAKRI